MSSMFRGCENLRKLNLSNVSTISVRNMSSTFYKCYQLENLDLYTFSAHNVEDSQFMFILVDP